MRLGQTSAIHFTAKLLAAAISFVAVIYFARLLGADVLGHYYLVIALLAWLQIAGRLGIGSAIIKRMSEGEDQGAYVAAGGVLIAVLFGMMSLALLLFRGHVDRYVGVEVTDYIVLMLFATLLYSYFGAILKGRHLVHVAGLLTPVRIATRSLLQIGAVFAGFGLIGLLTGYAVGWVLVALLALLVIIPPFDLPRKRHFLSLVNYAKYSWLGSVKSKTFNWIDVLVLGFFVPSGLVGIYSVAWSIAIFLVKFSQSLSTALFPEISQLSSDGDHERISGLVNDATAYAGIFLVPGLVGGVLLSERILRIYGGEFTEGSVVLVVLIVAVLLYGYQKQLLTTLNGIDRPDLAFRVNGIFVASNVVLNVVLIYFFGWVGAAVATTASATIGLLVSYYYIIALLDFQIPYLEITRQWTAAIVMGVIVYGGLAIEDSYNLLQHNAATVFLLVGTGAGVYFATYFAISSRFRQTVVDNFPIELPSGLGVRD